MKLLMFWLLGVPVLVATMAFVHHPDHCGAPNAYETTDRTTCDRPSSNSGIVSPAQDAPSKVIAIASPLVARTT